MTIEQCVHDADVQGRIADGIARRPLCNVVAAMFSFDLDDRDVDFDAVERIQAGDFDDWVRATARSGLFTPRELETLARLWHANPRSLFEELLTDSDDLTHRRYEIVWESLNQADTREYA